MIKQKTVKMNRIKLVNNLGNSPYIIYIVYISHINLPTVLHQKDSQAFKVFFEFYYQSCHRHDITTLRVYPAQELSRTCIPHVFF